VTVYDPPNDIRAISVRSLLDDPALELTVRLVAGDRGLDRQIDHARIQKSGLVLVGHKHGLVPSRVQILGETELSFIESLSPEAQERAAEQLFSLRPACVMITRGVDVPLTFLAAAETSATPVVVCQQSTSQAITALHTLLDERLAPRARIHGVLVDVFEVGVLLLGKSGIGKSECALELVMRGHRLVADDIVECDYRPPGMIFGEPAPLLRHHIEVRGLGILDIKDLYGVTAIRERKRVDLIVRLEESAMGSTPDRIGVEDRTWHILDVPIREVALPVRPGRNMSSIIEIAARHELLRQAGHDSSREFIDQLDRALTRKPNESGAMRAVLDPRTVHGVRVRPSESAAPPPGRQKGRS
jgi:HPr kinase/phosphorylase